MTKETFENILRSVKLPCGTLLKDGKTYRIEKPDFPDYTENGEDPLMMFDFFLALSDGKDHVVGGVLFYGSTDIQIQMLPEHQGKGYMSALHKSGILQEECSPNQKVSVIAGEIHDFQDFMKRLYLLDLLGLSPDNKPQLFEHAITLLSWGEISIEEYEIITEKLGGK